MALVSQISKTVIEWQCKLLELLEEKCSDCEFLRGLTPELQYIYTFHDMEGVCRGNYPMLAIAQYNSCKTYAIYSQGKMTQRELYAYERFLRDVKKYAESGEQIVVFSKENYEAVKKHVGNKNISVILYTR